MSNIWTGKDVKDSDFMAYVMSKMASFAWVRINMFFKDNIYECPPIFCWRYNKKTDDDIYRKISICVSNFQGRLKWAMYKSDGLHGKLGRNYIIEPEFIREIEKQHGIKKMPEILKSEYKEELQKAVEDVVPLAKFIEKEFGVENSDPIPVTYPSDDN